MPRPSRTAEPGTLFAGSAERPDAYELIGESIAGGEGVVWRALDHRLPTPGVCAVKILAAPAEADRRLLDENIRLLRHLSAAHVVRVHEILYGPPPHRRGRADAAAPEAVYLIMEWVGGPTLRQTAAGRRATAANLMERLKYVAQLAGALADLTPMNANAATHRDIKPGNCIINERRGLVLIDVTTLRAAGDGFDQDGLHTPEYAAPEVRKAPRRPRTAASEMFSLGAVAAFCLTGSDPAAVSSPAALARGTADLLRAAAEAGVDDPEAFVRHLLRAMAEDPRDRPDDPVAWSQVLIQLALRRPVDRTPPEPRPVRRWPIWAAAGLIVAAGIGLAVAARLPESPPRSSAGPTENAGSAAPFVRAAPSTAASRATPAPGHDSPTRAATRTTTGATINPAATAKTATVVTAHGTIAPVGPPAEVKSCAYFAGTAGLPAGTTLILTKRNLSNDNPAVYAELVFGWSDPATLTSWQGAQFFGSGDESTGQNYEVGLRAVPLAAAQEFHDSGEKDFGQAIAKLGTRLDAVQVLRVAGEGPNGCPGPSA